jgi:hypothetical protein
MLLRTIRSKMAESERRQGGGREEEFRLYWLLEKVGN